MTGLQALSYFKQILEFLVEIAGRAGDINSSWNAALAILHALYDSRRFVALGAIGGLRRVHYLLAIACLGNFGHSPGVSPS